jgi:hypothetical protein
MTPRSPQSLTDDLKNLIEVLEAKNQGQAYVRVQVLLSDLKELTMHRRNPATREYSYPAELAGVDMNKVLALRKAMARIATDIQAGHLDQALEGCRRELATWAESKER